MILALTDSITLWTLLLLPCFFWGAYHYYKDRQKPEPVLMLVLAVFLGYLSAYIGLFLYHAVELAGFDYHPFILAQESERGLFWYCVLVIGPVEELAKFIPFALVLARSRFFDEEVDGIIYAAFIGLGFALHENRYYLQILEGNLATVRSLIMPIIHALFASVWGYAWGFSGRFGIRPWVFTLLGLLLAMLLHGIYDYYVFAISVFGGLCPPLIVLCIWLWRGHTIRRATRGISLQPLSTH